MSNNSMVLFGGNGAVPALSNKFGALVQAGVGMDLGDGIRSSYAIVSIKGGKFRIKYKSEERILDMPHPQDPSQRLPLSFIDVVIVKANPFLNKQFYEGNYVEGSTEAPDCYSLDGKVPSPNAPRPQHTNCALCPKNQWGSKIGDNGQKQKACRDTKKLAIVPLVDIKNSTMGGAMLFRVPPSALKDLSVMSDALKGRGYPYNSVAVRIGFDTTVSHPKPTFQALRPLNDDEADQVLEMFQSDSVASVLADGDEVPAHQEVPQSAQFIQPAPVVAPSATATPATHNWVPGTPAPRIDPSRVPPPPPAAPAPQMPQQLLNQPDGTPLAQAAPGTVAIQPFQPSAPPPPPPTVMHAPVQAQPAAVVVQPDDPPVAAPVAAPAGNPFAPPAVTAAAPAAPAKAPAQRRKPVTPVAPPAAVAAPSPAPEPVPATAGQLDSEISDILSGLGDFMGGAK
jgi:hypothetical protein